MINLGLLRDRRRKLGWTVREASHAMGFSSATGYHRIETGRAKVNVVQLKQLAMIFNLTWEELLGDATGRLT